MDKTKGWLMKLMKLVEKEWNGRVWSGWASDFEAGQAVFSQAIPREGVSISGQLAYHVMSHVTRIFC